MNGEIARIGEPFSNGLQYPGDKNSRPEEFINCRCTLVPYIPDFDMIAPNNKNTWHEEDMQRLPTSKGQQITLQLQENIKLYEVMNGYMKLYPDNIKIKPDKVQTTLDNLIKNNQHTLKNLLGLDKQDSKIKDVENTLDFNVEDNKTKPKVIDIKTPNFNKTTTLAPQEINETTRQQDINTAKKLYNQIQKSLTKSKQLDNKKSEIQNEIIPYWKNRKDIAIDKLEEQHNQKLQALPKGDGKFNPNSLPHEEKIEWIKLHNKNKKDTLTFVEKSRFKKLTKKGTIPASHELEEEYKQNKKQLEKKYEKIEKRFENKMERLQKRIDKIPYDRVEKEELFNKLLTKHNINPSKHVPHSTTTEHGKRYAMFDGVEDDLYNYHSFSTRYNAQEVKRDAVSEFYTDNSKLFNKYINMRNKGATYDELIKIVETEFNNKIKPYLTGSTNGIKSKYKNINSINELRELFEEMDKKLYESKQKIKGNTLLHSAQKLKHYVGLEVGDEIPFTGYTSASFSKKQTGKFAYMIDKDDEDIALLRFLVDDETELVFMLNKAIPDYTNEIEAIIPAYQHNEILEINENVIFETDTYDYNVTEFVIRLFN